MKITRYKSIGGNTPVVAFLDIHLSKIGLTLKDCKLIRNTNGHMFVSAPCKKFITDDGDKFYPFWVFDKEFNNFFQKGAKGAIEKYVQENKVALLSKPQETEDDVPF